MMSNLFLKPQLHLLLLLPFPSKPFFSHTLKYKPSFPPINTFSTAITTTLSYGPSLHKGTDPFPLSSQSQLPQNDGVLNEQTFTRIFNLAALRVPSSDCSALENRLRGHLLNWPRIRNIARVPGDEIDPNIASLLGQKSEESNEGGDGNDEALSPVLYRDKLAKTFNTRGFVKFRNLAKISRPNRNNKKKEKEVEKGKIGEVEGNKRVGRNGFAEVEVFEEEGVDEGLRNLIGEEIGSGKWKGSTRLLLLDERYKDRCVDELPEAIKVPFL